MRIIKEKELQEWINRGKAELIKWFEQRKATSNITPPTSTPAAQRYARRGEGIHVPEHVRHASDIQQELREMANRVPDRPRRESIMEAIRNMRRKPRYTISGPE
jgi:hypothetical protein